jgi:hypothetical protein
MERLSILQTSDGGFNGGPILHLILLLRWHFDKVYTTFAAPKPISLLPEKSIQTAAGQKI